MIFLNDFKREYFLLKDEIDTAIDRVLKSGYFILGEECNKFEKEFAGYIKSKYCIGVGSGTDAINLSLRAAGIKSGDEVITTCLTAYPTIIGIIEAGGIPVLVDINTENCLINEELIKNKITSKTKFIIPVHLYGQSVNMEKILRIAEEYGLKIIEDCAQAVGATYKGKKTGSFGTASAFSFYPTKNLGAYGDGGAVITNDENIFKKLLQIRNCGQKNRYYHDVHGINSRLDELQAAILRVKLRHLDKRIKRRRIIAGIYDKNLKVKKLKESENNKHTYHLYVIFSANRDKLKKYLASNGIQSLIHYPIPIYKQKALNYEFKDNEFSVTDKLTKEILSIPINSELSDSEVETIIDKINSFKD